MSIRNAVMILAGGLVWVFPSIADDSGDTGPTIRWQSEEIIESRMPVYKYHMGPKYPPPGPGEKNPGSNYGSTRLTVSDDPPRLLDRVLLRDAELTGTIQDPVPNAKAGRVWLEDNYGRVLDEASLTQPGEAFTLDASRSLKTGLMLKAELTDGETVLWSGSEEIRMVPPGDPWADFILGVYNMGTRPGTGELWREMGLDHRAIRTTNSPAYSVQNDLQFHASNIVYSLLGLYHRDYKRWWEIREHQTEHRGDTVTLARHRCLSDPKEKKFIRDILTAAAMRFRPYQPLHYSIGDEIGIGDMASPHDLCASEWCLPRYRQWLKTRYGSLEALNAEWDSDYDAWEDVPMASTWAALGRAESANFSPWADRLEFMDHVLYSAVGEGVDAIRSIDPDATCNVSGVQQPSCWGYDHYLLTQTVNCATPYEIGEGPDVLMSFFDDGRTGKLHSPGFGSDREGLWRAFVRGYHISAQWDSFGSTYSKLIDVENNTLTPLGEKIRDFAEWVHAGPGRLRNRSLRQRDPVAILYSQPSLRANWILELTQREDVHDRGEQWVTRGSWSVRQRELSFRVRVSWVQWLHDVGIWPKFVDARELGEDYLTRQGYKVLILPRVVAMSDKTAAAIRRFAESGGLVIADSWCGLMDEHAKLRPDGQGVLDDCFGVSRENWRSLDLRKLPPGGEGIVVKDRPTPFMPLEKTLRATTGKPWNRDSDPVVLVERTVGKGKVLYLNFRMESYFLHRMTPAMVDTARALLLGILKDGGVEPMFHLRDKGSENDYPSAGHDLCAYRNGRGFLLGVRMNPTMMHSEVGGVEEDFKNRPGNVFVNDQPVELEGPEELWVYDLNEGKALGRGTPVAFTSKVHDGRLFAYWPFEIEGIEASADVDDDRQLHIQGRLKTSSPVEGEKLVVHLRILRPDGTEQRAYRQWIDCDGNSFALNLPMGLNEHGDWKVLLRDPCSGSSWQETVTLP